MDKVLLLLGSLFAQDPAVCPKTEILVEDGLTWGSEDDINTMRRATFVCGTDPYYKNDTPCLVKFTKYGKLDYRALCGAKVRGSNDD
jgi:hypothetical protein